MHIAEPKEVEEQEYHSSKFDSVDFMPSGGSLSHPFELEEAHLIVRQYITKAYMLSFILYSSSRPRCTAVSAGSFSHANFRAFCFAPS